MNFVVLVGAWELDAWQATLVYPGTTTTGLRQIVSGSQADVQLDGTKIEMLFLVVMCV